MWPLDQEFVVRAVSGMQVSFDTSAWRSDCICLRRRTWSSGVRIPNRVAGDSGRLSSPLAHSCSARRISSPASLAILTAAFGRRSVVPLMNVRLISSQSSAMGLDRRHAGPDPSRWRPWLRRSCPRWGRSRTSSISANIVM